MRDAAPRDADRLGASVRPTAGPVAGDLALVALFW